MRLEKTPEKLDELDEKLKQVRQATDDYHTVQTGFIHYHLPEKSGEVAPYIGAKVSEDEFLEAGYTVVEHLAGVERIFEDLRDARKVFSKLNDSMKIKGRRTKNWEYEIDNYMVEYQQTVRNVLEISEPVDEIDGIDFDLSLEYLKRTEDTAHRILDDA